MILLNFSISCWDFGRLLDLIATVLFLALGSSTTCYLLYWSGFDTYTEVMAFFSNIQISGSMLFLLRYGSIAWVPHPSSELKLGVYKECSLGFKIYVSFTQWLQA